MHQANARLSIEPAMYAIHRKTIAAAFGMLSLVHANATITIGDGLQDSAEKGTNLPELVLIIWDRSAKVSYTKDLGINAYTSNYESGDTSTNLYVYGQQESGFQHLYPALNSDPNFIAFQAASSGIASQSWAILGAEINADVIVGAGSNTLFMTLTNGDFGSGTNDKYIDLTGTDKNGNVVAGDHFNNSELQNSAGNFATWSNDVATSASAFNTHKTQANGSSFDTEASIGYVGKLLPGNGGTLISNGHGSVLNPVGSSSWFYRAVTSSDINDASLTVDEFDNHQHDAYWGLGVDGSGNYILSYTMEAALTQPQSFAGSLLRLRTEFAASYGKTRLIGAPVGDTLNLGNVSAVPEPATWGLMGLGLAALAARARRRGQA
nr:PEP-CTERM sorting domain-containing protein [Pelomonas sp. P8]